MTYPDPTRPGSHGHDEPNVLELLGFGAPSTGTPAPPATNLPPHARAAIGAAPAGSRREQRELERKPQSGSAARRIRAIEKAHRKAARKLPKGARVSVATTAAARPARGSSRARSIGSRILSVSAMIFAGALAVGMSVPANAFNTGANDDVLTQAADQTVQPQQEATQSMAADSTVTTTSAARDEYTVTSWAEMLRLQYGTRDYSYTMGDPNGPIRWPFPYPVPISSGYGERSAPCRGCSSMHMGVDFTPGVGTPIYAIADGVVTTSLADQWGFGTHVIITHTINGQTVTSTYAHMQAGSTALVAGEQISVGDFIGTVGMTGTATGNHLHFEITVDGANVDPFAWLQANT
jgi:murein DD-endopeptidase MepM/ murein hydrolase activator NlpD